MSDLLFKYSFSHDLDMAEVEGAFVLAILATESIHGESDTRLLAEHAMDLTKRTCVVDGSTPIGRDLNRLFVGFLRREFGDDEFSVHRLNAVNVTPSNN